MRQSANYFDFEDGIVAHTEETLGFGDVLDKAYDASDAMVAAMNLAQPAIRTSVLELLMKQPDNTLWDPQVGDIESMQSDIACIGQMTARVSDAFTELITVKQYHKEARNRVVELPWTRQALMDGVQTCYDRLDPQAIARFARSSDSRGHESLFRHLELLKYIRDTDNLTGYHLEVLKRHFYRTVDFLCREKLFDIVDTDMISEDEKRCKAIMDTYHIGRIPLGQMPEGDIEEDESDIFIDTQPVYNYFDTYVQHIRDQKSQISSSVYSHVLTQRSSPRRSESFDQAAANIEMRGNIPLRLMPDNLYAFLGRRMVPAALASCQYITFRPFSNAEAVIYDQQGRNTDMLAAGIHRGYGEIDINTRLIKTAKRLREVVAHEIGHAFMRSLRIGDLSDYETVRKSEPNRFSTYVHWTAENIPDNEALEDFAEAYMYYYTRSEVLRRRAPNRYDFLQSIIDDFRSMSGQRTKTLHDTIAL